MQDFRLEPLPQAGGTIISGHYKTPFGISRTVIVRLHDEGKYLVYSPGEPLLKQAQERLGKDADIVLVAPSLGHTLGIAAWSEAFPKARLVFSTGNNIT